MEEHGKYGRAAEEGGRQNLDLDLDLRIAVVVACREGVPLLYPWRLEDPQDWCDWVRIATVQGGGIYVGQARQGEAYPFFARSDLISYMYVYNEARDVMQDLTWIWFRVVSTGHFPFAATGDALTEPGEPGEPG